MKKILFILFVTIASLNAKSCMTDIYFGNGVWNDRDDAIENQIALRNFMLLKANIRLDIQKEEINYTFQYIHNPSRGVIDDLIETFWQLYQSGQISYPYFYNQSAMLSVATGDITNNEIWEKINAVVSDYNNDIVTMLHKYQEESFDQKHNVLLVAHSQGNLFGNKMYTMLTDKQKQKFRMVSVATPAYYVKVPGQTSPYVTVIDDPVINIIPNALDDNVDGIGHKFVSTYLVGSINAPRKIALYVKSAYDDLIQTSTCTESLYEYVFIRVYETEHLEVVGYSKELKENVAIGTTDIQILRENADYCGADYYHYGLYPYFNDAHNPNYYLWNVGPFRSKDELISRKDTSLNFYLYGSYGDNCAIISLSGELYNLVLSAFGDYDESEEYVESETPPPIYMYSS